MRSRDTSRIFLSGMLGLLILTPVWAQEGGQQEQTEEEAKAEGQATIVEEVTVVARKAKELLNEIPITIQALTAEDIEEIGITSIDDIATATPGLHISNYLGSRDDPGLRFRGMDSGTRNRLAQNSSAYIDGVFLPRTSQLVSLGDVERAEVVKGPQSVFYGRAAFGGALNLVTKTPTSIRVGDVVLTGGENGRLDASLGISGPLSDNVNYRFFGRYFDYDGGWDNLTPNSETLGAQQTTAASFSISANVSDRSLLKFRYMHSEDEDGPGAFAFWPSSTLNCGPFGGGDRRYFCGELNLANALPVGFDTTIDTSPPETNWPTDGFGLVRDFDLASLNFDWFGRNVSVSSLTSYLVDATENLADFTGTGTLLTYFDDEDTLFSQELRVQGQGDKIDWLLGLFYFDGEFGSGNQGFGCASENYLVFGFLPGCVINGIGPNIRGVFDLDVGPTRTIENTAVFGSVTYRASDKVALSLEVRAANEKLDFGEVFQAVDGTTNELSGEFDSVTPRFILDFKPNPDSTYYLNVARGNKPGNFNSDLADIAASALVAFEAEFGAGLEVPEEKVLNYEVGMKRAFGQGGGHQLNLAVYYMDWTNQQFNQFVNGFDSNGDGVSGAGDEAQLDYLTSAGKSEIQGVEVFYTGRLNDYTNLMMSYNYNDAKYLEFEDGSFGRVFGTRDASGQRQPRSPENSGVFSFSFNHPLGKRAMNYFVRADATYTGSSYTWALNLAETGDSTKVNLRLGVENDRYRLTFFGNNLTDDDTVGAIRRFTDLTTFRTGFWGGLPTPREVGATLRVNLF